MLVLSGINADKHRAHDFTSVFHLVVHIIAAGQLLARPNT
jgi:hypothetical protein